MDNEYQGHAPGVPAAWSPTLKDPCSGLPADLHPHPPTTHLPMLSSLYKSMCEALKFSFCTRSKGGGGGPGCQDPRLSATLQHSCSPRGSLGFRASLMERGGPGSMGMRGSEGHPSPPGAAACGASTAPACPGLGSIGQPSPPARTKISQSLWLRAGFALCPRKGNAGSGRLQETGAVPPGTHRQGGLHVSDGSGCPILRVWRPLRGPLNLGRP